jgi:hypothetical protein
MIPIPRNWAKDPSPVLFRLVKAPEQDALSPRERAGDSMLSSSPRGRGLSFHIDTWGKGEGPISIPFLEESERRRPERRR